METLRCPTCVALLPDPDARRCPLCHSKLRKKRRGSAAVVLGESGRLSRHSLPSDVEFHVRAEERFLPDEKRLDEIVHDPANLPHAAPVASAEHAVPPWAPVAAKKSETVDAVLTFAPTAPAVQTPEPDIDLTAEAEPEPIVDLTTEPLAEPAVASINEAAHKAVSDSSDLRRKSAWQTVSARGSSPLDGSLDDIVGELHRKAREDNWNHGSR
jgi:hypothetical protein